MKCSCGRITNSTVYPIHCVCGITHHNAQYANCPHRIKGTCDIATQIAQTPCVTSEEICLACSICTRPNRLNPHTLALAYDNNRALDISHIQAVIDGTSPGFGERLANTIGLFFRSVAGCGCEGHKDILDVWTKEYIQDNLDTVIDWLQTEAKTRGLPFSRVLVRLLLLGLLKNQDQP